MKIALVGNQNSGKTTLFNLLTGSNQKVGNWPGVTIERKEGVLKGTDLTIVDLPGIYSLSPYTSEEEVSRDYILEENPDVIINIIDATSIERSLYLTTQLLELDCDVVLALNMADLLAKKGININIPKLEELLDTTVVEISALKETGINELIETIKEEKFRRNRHKKIYQDNVEKSISKILLNKKHKRFLTLKTLEKDEKFKELENENLVNERSKLEETYNLEIEQIIANQRYEYIVDIKTKCVTKNEQKETITD